MNDNTTVPQTPDIEKAAELLRAATDAEIQRNALWMTNNRQAVAAIQPAWADPALTFYDDGGPTIEFRRKFDKISMFQSFAVDNLQFTPERPVEITINAVASDINRLPAEDSLHTAVALLQAFDAYNGTVRDEPITDHKTVAEQKHEGEQRSARWLAEHADVIATVQPAWADSTRTQVDFDDEDGLVESIMFCRQVGTVAIEQMFWPENGFGAPYPAGEPQVWEDDNGPKAIGQATVVGTDLVKAAQILNGPGEVTASMFEILANALGIDPVDLYALASVDKDPENEITMGDLFRMSRYVGLTPMDLYNLAQQNEASSALVRRRTDVDENLQRLDG